MAHNIYTIEFINPAGERCKRYYCTWYHAAQAERAYRLNGLLVLTYTNEDTKPTKCGNHSKLHDIR